MLNINRDITASPIQIAYRHDNMCMSALKKIKSLDSEEYKSNTSF